MRKLTAIATVWGWSAFWIFGAVALVGGDEGRGYLAVTIALAALGFFAGVAGYLKLAREAGGQTWR